MDTMRRIVHVESSYNPYAIGVVGGRLERQPRDKGRAEIRSNLILKPFSYEGSSL